MAEISYNVFLNGPFPASFCFIFVFSIQLTKTMFKINFADDGIRTADLRCQKQLLRQLSHTTAPTMLVLILFTAAADVTQPV